MPESLAHRLSRLGSSGFIKVQNQDDRHSDLTIVTLSRSARELLEKLDFRAPDPCYLVGAHKGRRALVVTTMLVSKSLSRSGAYNWAPTIRDLEATGLIELGEDLSEVPAYDYREPTDFRWGNKVSITEAGRQAIGRGGER